MLDKTYSSDHKLLAVATSLGISLYDLQTLSVLWARDVVVGSVAISPDNSTLIVTTARGIELWKAADGTLLRSIKSLDGQWQFCVASCDYGRLGVVRLGDVAFSPDGRLVAAVLNYLRPAESGEGGLILDGTVFANKMQVFLWQTSTGDFIRTIEGAALGINSLKFSPDGQALGVIGYKGVQIWQISDEGFKPVRLLGPKGPSNRTVDFSPDGQLVAVGGYDASEVLVWHVEGGVKRSVQVEANIYDLRFVGDGTLLRVATRGGVHLIRIEDGSEVTFPTGSVGDVSPDGTVVAVFDTEGPLQLLRLNDNTVLHTLEVRGIQESLFVDSGQNLLIWFNTGFQLWRVADGTQLGASESGPTSIASRLVFSPNSSMLAIHQWTGEQIVQLKDGTVTSPSSLSLFRPDSSLIELRGSGADVEVVQPDTGAVIARLQGIGGLPAVAFLSPDGATLALPWSDRTNRIGYLTLWRLADGSLIRKLRTGLALTNAAFSPDSRLFVGGYLLSLTIEQEGIPVHVWSSSDGRDLHTLPTGLYADSLAWSPDGNLLAVNTFEVLRVYQAANWRLVATLGSHKDPAPCQAAVFSSDGALLFCGLRDGQLLAWQTADWSLVSRLQAHTDQITALAMSPDGTLLASGSYDGVVRLWGIWP